MVDKLKQFFNNLSRSKLPLLKKRRQAVPAINIEKSYSVPDTPEELLNLYLTPIHSLCLRLLQNHHDAEEAANTAMANAWKNRKTYRRDTPFIGWLRRIASNASRDIQRNAHS